MRFKVSVSYDGSEFHGWQKQNHVRSVQEEIEICISKISKKETKIYASGRTDAKVHALNQVFHFDSEVNMTSDNWEKALQSLLPDDILVNRVEEVDDNFHARYDAKSKEYRYHILQGEQDVFKRNYAYYIGESLDIKTMKHAAAFFIGTHDFSSFNATSYEEISDQVRTVYSIDIYRVDNGIVIKVIGDGFLRYMVRMMVGSLIEIGKHKHEPEFIQDKLNEKTKGIVPYRAPAHALYLYSVRYD